MYQDPRLENCFRIYNLSILFLSRYDIYTRGYSSMKLHFIEENDYKEATYCGDGGYLLLQIFENTNVNIADRLIM